MGHLASLNNNPPMIFGNLTIEFARGVGLLKNPRFKTGGGTTIDRGIVLTMFSIIYNPKMT